jgi:predicted short-subunit dehydrogenase-like oxidoreductase (DUF2520 family)
MDGDGAIVKPGRLDVGVVGAGRVGAVLGAALRLAEHRVVGASGISEASASRIDALLPGTPRLDPEAVVRAADLVLLTVPDDALATVVAGLAAVGAWRPGQIAVHASGLHGLGVLDPAASLGVTALAVHPAMTFTGTSIDLARIREAVFAVTAAAPVLPIALALVVELGGEPVVVADRDRALYHAGVVHGANNVVALVTQAMDALRAAGVEDPGRLLGPLVRASIDGALSEGPGAATTLTGPVVRGDVRTVAAHLVALRSHPATLRTYRTLARATTDIALEAGRINAAQYAGLMDVLEEPE